MASTRSEEETQMELQATRSQDLEEALSNETASTSMSPRTDENKNNAEFIFPVSSLEKDAAVKRSSDVAKNVEQPDEDKQAASYNLMSTCWVLYLFVWLYTIFTPIAFGVRYGLYAWWYKYEWFLKVSWATSFFGISSALAMTGLVGIASYVVFCAIFGHVSKDPQAWQWLSRFVCISIVAYPIYLTPTISEMNYVALIDSDQRMGEEFELIAYPFAALPMLFATTLLIWDRIFTPSPKANKVTLLE